MSSATTQTVTLTQQQARPLGVREASVALSAAAGCGKTTVLTARFLAELEAPTRRPLRSMVGLTFTEKSARELRQRIRKWCGQRLAQGEDAAYWRSLLRALAAAPVGTFHEFCAGWLRDHAIEAGIDPDFAILDETVAETVREEALAKSLRQWLSAKNDDLIVLAVEFGLGPVRKAIGTLMCGRSGDELAAWADRSVREIVAAWASIWETTECPRLLASARTALEACCAFLDRPDLSHPKLRDRGAALAERLAEFDRRAEVEGWLKEVQELAKVPPGLRKADWPSEAINEMAKVRFQAVREAIKDYGTLSRWDEAAALEAAEHGRRFTRLALQARQAYDAAKRARGGLDFDDLLLKTCDLLRAASDSERTDLAGRFEFLLVDEFQDTDPVQGEILRLICGERVGDGRLFLVGDTKQSIYRFRGAQPRIFQEFRAEFFEDGCHELTENFRSVPGILDFVNALFHGVFPDPASRLVPSPVTPEPDSEPVVELLWASEPVVEGESKLTAREARRAEARWLASNLKNRLDRGWMIRDDRTGTPRKAEPKDIALLFRAMTDVAPFEAALTDEGIDYHTIGGSAFYAQQEITDLINVLSVVEDPRDEVSLAGALRSPFFCVSDDGLFRLGFPPGDLPERLRRAGELDGLSDRDRRHATRASALLARWRGLKDRVPIATLVDRILDESGYEAALLGEFLGGRKRANARKLVRIARTFDGQGGFTVADFVAMLRSQLRRSPREEQAATTDEEGTSVRLMSIHQAKGLEFPIVVLPDLDRKSREVTESVAFDAELGPLVRLSADRETESSDADRASDHASESLGWRIYRIREGREDDEEALRLFYVATTRAKDALILSAGVDPTEKPKSPAMRLLDAQFDRATGACRVALPEGWGEPRVRVIDQQPPSSSDRGRSANRWPDLEQVARIIREAKPTESSVPTAPARRLRFVDLDPGHELSPRQARMIGLVHEILTDSRAVSPRDLPELARRAALGQSPALSPALADEAVELLLLWLSGPLGVRLREARAIERGMTWTIAWPPDVPDPTVFHGRLDLACQDHSGEWSIVNVCLPDAPESRERARLLLSLRAAEDMGLRPIREGCLVVLGPENQQPHTVRCDPSAVTAAVVSLVTELHARVHQPARGDSVT